MVGDGVCLLYLYVTVVEPVTFVLVSTDFLIPFDLEIKVQTDHCKLEEDMTWPVCVDKEFSTSFLSTFCLISISQSNFPDMGQSKSCAWKSPELQCRVQRKPNADNAKVDELPNDNAITNRSNLKLLSSPKLYGNRDGVETNGFMLIDFKGRPFYHNRENSLLGCEVHLPTHLFFI